eukprot:COSAG01_NODE_72064_length_254_cov_0.658065_1_plen_49_part_01
MARRMSIDLILQRDQYSVARALAPRRLLAADIAAPAGFGIRGWAMGPSA